MNKIEVMLIAPPERERLVVELWSCDEMLGAINAETPELMVEFFSRQSRKPWVLNLDEVIRVLQLAKKTLDEKYSDEEQSDSALQHE